MISGFIGKFYHTLDEKFRISLPRKFYFILQSESENKLVILKAPERCLLVYPASKYESYLAKVSALSEFNPLLLPIRAFLGNITPVTMDNQGRILIPKELLSYADIKKEIVILGDYTRLQLWNPQYLNSLIEKIDINQLYLFLSEQLGEKIASEIKSVYLRPVTPSLNFDLKNE